MSAPDPSMATVASAKLRGGHPILNDGTKGWHGTLPLELSSCLHHCAWRMDEEGVSRMLRIEMKADAG